MTIETKIDPSTEPAKPDWMPKARRHGERTQWVKRPRKLRESADEAVFAPMPPPVTWPRVFPGI
jgi:hypothetical protein